MTTLGIDLGTGSAKVAVVEDDGTVISSAVRPYPVEAPEPGWMQSDPARWRAAVLDAVDEAIAAAGAVPRAVGLSGQMHGVVLADASLRPLRPAVLWADGRARAEASEMARALGRDGQARLGSPAVPGFAGTTLAWLQRHEPQLVAGATHALLPKDWLRASLGGEVGTDPSDASGTLLFDVIDGDWSAAALAWLGAPARLLPVVRPSDAPAGTIRLGAYELPVVTGGADTACVVAGLGLQPGDGFIAVGTGAQVVRLLDDPAVDASLRTHTFVTAGSPGWYRLGAVQSAGLVLEPALAWLGATVGEATAALTPGVQPDDPIFVPFLAGERTPFMDSSLRGAWQGLSLGTDRAALLRSVLEGLAQAVALGVRAVDDTGATLPAQVPLVGGGTHDPAFRQLLADATGRTLLVVDAPDAAVIGAARLAGGAAHASGLPSTAAPVEPRPTPARLLAERRERMLQLIDAQERA